MAAFSRRSALGQKVPIGTFYSAQTDTFLPGDLLRSELLIDAVNTTTVNKSTVLANEHDTYQGRFGVMNISPELSASIQADMVDYKGSSRYLAEHSMERTPQAALHRTIDTITEQMNFGSAALRACLATNTINDQRITHVVVGIEWGCSSVVVARINSDSMLDTESTKAQFQTDFVTFVSAAEVIENDPSINGENFSKNRNMAH
jgi:hypothetical protein